MRNSINQNGKYVKKLDTIYIGYDPRDHDASDLLIESILKFASKPLNIITLNQNSLRRAGLYRRAAHIDSTVWGEQDGNMRDRFDEQPYSTEFSFTRFLVPFLNQYEGFALFMDNDMFFRSDPCEIFEKFANDDAPPVSCVKHEYIDGGKAELKLYGCPQTFYPKKNWSSFMLWNCGHPANSNLTVDDVSTKSGTWLHNFKWLEDKDIGSLPEEWNWLAEHSDESIEAKNVHFTLGGPWFNRWNPQRASDKKYGDEWSAFSNDIFGRK